MPSPRYNISLHCHAVFLLNNHLIKGVVFTLNAAKKLKSLLTDPSFFFSACKSFAVTMIYTLLLLPQSRLVYTCQPNILVTFLNCKFSACIWHNKYIQQSTTKSTNKNSVIPWSEHYFLHKLPLRYSCKLCYSTALFITLVLFLPFFSGI